MSEHIHEFGPWQLDGIVAGYYIYIRFCICGEWETRKEKVEDE